ncbi:unnamed protein product [Closterium sp. Naga37s-1]|nr:unnamed protein product [Closterium sp. Naga37s-1]
MPTSSIPRSPRLFFQFPLFSPTSHLDALHRALCKSPSLFISSPPVNHLVAISCAPQIALPSPFLPSRHPPRRLCARLKSPSRRPFSLHITHLVALLITIRITHLVALSLAFNRRDRPRDLLSHPVALPFSFPFALAMSHPFSSPSQSLFPSPSQSLHFLPPLSIALTLSASPSRPVLPRRPHARPGMPPPPSPFFSPLPSLTVAYALALKRPPRALPPSPPITFLIAFALSLPSPLQSLLPSHRPIHLPSLTSYPSIGLVLTFSPPISLALTFSPPLAIALTFSRLRIAFARMVSPPITSHSDSPLPSPSRSRSRLPSPSRSHLLVPSRRPRTLSSRPFLLPSCSPVPSRHRARPSRPVPSPSCSPLPNAPRITEPTTFVP